MSQSTATRTDPADDDAARRREKIVHEQATKYRAEMILTELMEALVNADAAESKAILEAARTYDDAELGKLVSRRLQRFFRAMANYEEREPLPVFLRKQAD